MENEDVPLMEDWLKKTYILEWYVHPDDWLHEIKERRGEFCFIRHFITMIGRKPVGFCQYYRCSDAMEDWYGDISLDGAFSIDYLIGEEEYLGKGYGKATVLHLTETVFSLQDAKRILVQPDPENQASCRTLMACGFTYDEKNKLFYKVNPFGTVPAVSPGEVLKTGIPGHKVHG